MNESSGRTDTVVAFDFARAAAYDKMECRSMLRLEAPFPATVRGLDLNGQQFEEHTQLINVSADGLCVWLERSLALGTTIFVAVRLTLDVQHPDGAPGFAVRGVVLRSRPYYGGWAHALLFVRHRFLFAAFR